VPFGEYIPFRQQLGWLTKISKAAPANVIPGTGAHVLYATDRTGQPLPIGVLICFESAFPDMSRVDTDHGAQMIIYQTSDSTWQAGWEQWVLAQHASLGALRAAETGRPVVQAALTGDSAAFDAPAAGMGRTQRAWRHPGAAGAAAGFGPHPLRPAWRLRSVDGHRDHRDCRCLRPDPDGPETTCRDSSASPGADTVGPQPHAWLVRHGSE
jgi:hypothetical protein